MRLYLLRRRTDGEWPLMGHVNLEKLRTDHVVAPGADAVATLMALTPAAVLAAEPEG